MVIVAVAVCYPAPGHTKTTRHSANKEHRKREASGKKTIIIIKIIIISNVSC